MDKLLEKWDNNFKQMQAKDSQAKRQCRLVGRYIYEPTGDGRAYYQIIKENKRTVVIKVVTGIGDDYRVAYWSEQATISKTYVLEQIGGRETLAEIFSGKS